MDVIQPAERSGATFRGIEVRRTSGLFRGFAASYDRRIGAVIAVGGLAFVASVVRDRRLSNGRTRILFRTMGYANTQAVRIPRSLSGRVSTPRVSVSETDRARERAGAVRGGLVKYALYDNTP
jgi:hypothetical protein